MMTTREDVCTITPEVEGGWIILMRAQHYSNLGIKFYLQAGLRPRIIQLTSVYYCRLLTLMTKDSNTSVCNVPSGSA
jgi:hypothetical protein